MPTLTVFTPTYNRAHCIHKLYESLCSQTSQDFCWLVIDDGSFDTTKELFNGWINEGKIDILYRYKENGGMHTAHNLAYSLIETEINICIDSDDFMPSDAVASILKNWEGCKNDKNIAGMVGLDQDVSGNLIGTSFPSNIKESTLGRLYNNKKIRGDKKLVYRSVITKAYPSYPEYQDERLVPLSRLYTLIDRDYHILCVNSFWVIVDYQENGSSATILKQYFQSPKGFRDARVTNIKYGEGCFFRFKNIIHLGVSNFILKEDFRTYSPYPFISFITAPISYFIYCYLKRKL